jgi:hypothetical protein
MGHPTVENVTPFAVELLFLADEEARPLLVPLVLATYDLVASRGLVLAAKQPGPNLTGERWSKDPQAVSFRIEPTYAFTKPATDVVLVGHAQDNRRRAVELDVVFRVGPVGKVLRVIGDRLWVRSAGAISATKPVPFERIPLCYERAFGGWDRSDRDPARHAFEPRNPVGTGFRAPGSHFEEGVHLPNIENPSDLLHQFGQVVTPTGTGFVSPDWHPRAAFAGTYDEAWSKARMPLLPKNFDRRFFNAASPGLIAPGYLAGDEPVLVENASPLGRLSFRLPGIRPPQCRVELARGASDAEVELRLDTVIVDTDADRVQMLYRGHLALRDGPHDVRTVAVEEHVAPVRAPSHWQPGVTA